MTHPVNPASSTERRGDAPSCIHRPTCDGCPLIEADTEEMLAGKVARLTHAMTHPEEFDGLQPEPILAAPSRSGWRHRARMVFGDPRRPGESLLGFYEAGSRDVVEITHCAAHHPQLERALDTLRANLGAHPQLTEDLRFVDARRGWREGRAEVIVTFCMNQRKEHTSRWQEDVLALHEVCQRELGEEILLGMHLDVGTRGSAIMSGELLQVCGPVSTRHDVEGSDSRVSVPLKAFFQVNPPQLDSVHALMREWAEEERRSGRIVDLYCGVGVHGFALAGEGARIVGVDSSEGAIEAARQIAGEGSRHRFEAAKDSDSLAFLDEALGEDRIDLVIANPARAGLHVSMVDWLGARRDAIGAILYLSCEPQTLARDLIRLRRLGFAIERIKPIDMMPNTEQVETLVKLVPGHAFTRVESYVEDALVAASEDRPRRLSPRVSGVRFEPGGEAEWFVALSGRPPRHGEPPRLKGKSEEESARIVCDRVHDGGWYSLVRVLTYGLHEDAELRQRMRAWGYPVLGDEDFGDRRANRLAARIVGLDRAALHCIRDDQVGEVWLSSELELAFLDGLDAVDAAESE